MKVPPLSALPPPVVPPAPDVEVRQAHPSFNPEALERLHPHPRPAPAVAAVTVALVVLVAACWALATRLIGPDAWAVAIGFAVVPVAVSGSWQRR